MSSKTSESFLYINKIAQFVMKMLKESLRIIARVSTTVDAGYKNTVGSRENVLISDMFL